MNFLELVKARHSVRSYVERPIEQSKLDYILECVRLAPSAVNFQPWKFAVVTEKNLLDAVKSTYPREWIKTAPCIIVACGNHDAAWHRKLDDKDHTDVDVAIQLRCSPLQGNTGIIRKLGTDSFDSAGLCRFPKHSGEDS